MRPRKQGPSAEQYMDDKKKRTASSGEQDSGDIKKTKGPLHAGTKTVELVKYMNGVGFLSDFEWTIVRLYD